MDQQHALQGKKYGIEQALTDEQRKALEELGMIWDHNQENGNSTIVPQKILQ